MFFALVWAISEPMKYSEIGVKFWPWEDDEAVGCGCQNESWESTIMDRVQFSWLVRHSPYNPTSVS